MFSVPPETTFVHMRNLGNNLRTGLSPNRSQARTSASWRKSGIKKMNRIAPLSGLAGYRRRSDRLHSAFFAGGTLLEFLQPTRNILDRTQHAKQGASAVAAARNLG